MKKFTSISIDSKKQSKGTIQKLFPFAWDHMDPKSRQRDFSPNFYDFLQNKNHGFFFSSGYDGQVCVGRIILVDFTLPLDSDFI